MTGIRRVRIGVFFISGGVFCRFAGRVATNPRGQDKQK